MTHSESRMAWPALFVGLTLGVIGGLYYAWVVDPVKFESVLPQQLISADKEAYVALVGAAYMQDQNLERAQARLNALGPGWTGAQIASLADAAYQRGSPPAELCSLAILAGALGGVTYASEVCALSQPPDGIAGVGTPTATFEAIATPTPTLIPPPIEIEPTLTPTLIQIPSDAAIKLIAEQIRCEDDYRGGYLEVYVLDTAGGGIPAVKVLVEWEGGSDTFFTGLKPEITPGFADFRMERDRIYSVTLVGLSEPVVGLSSADCLTESGRVSTPTYQLVFAPITDQP